MAAIKKIQSKVGSLFPTRLKHHIAKREKKTAEIGAVQCERLPLTVNKAGEQKSCLHSWAENPPLVLESLVANASVTENFQESNEFCSKEGKPIVVFGCDKGGDATSLLVRMRQGFVCHWPYMRMAQRTTTICPCRYTMKRSQRRSSCSSFSTMHCTWL